MTSVNNTLSVPRGEIPTRFFSQAYWEATREKRLLVQRCNATGQYQFFPRPNSIATGKRGLSWHEVDGRGELYSYTLTQRGTASLRGHEPYLVGLVRLDVGVDLITNLVVTDMAAIKIGMRVKPYWLPREDGTHLLLFQPDGGV